MITVITEKGKQRSVIMGNGKSPPPLIQKVSDAYEYIKIICI